MGFKLGRTYVLQFEKGSYLDGAEIRLRSANIDTVLALEELKAHDALPVFVDHVEEWNLEDRNGNPIPIEANALRKELELPVVNRLMRDWYKAAVGVAAPLDKMSSNGEESLTSDIEEQSIPMEIPSGPLAS